LVESRHQHPFYRWEQRDLLLWVTVQQGDRLRVRLAAPPVEGKANQALIALLSEMFKVPPSSLVIESGATAKTKRVRIKSPRILPDFINKPM
jgi:uncharacterized protein (TIGR00251 family)